ncbi:D-alanyl-D-alanine carboxypeptidase [Kitasatospora sp. MAA4]|uniref:serine hydrolase domain-containing protein n=1 Tax=Kitasatospora sp. MAA4 TaxID=3035093 RepID=UPI002476D39A|nr:serine hydrolase domain-containing protein [Kitasatospora sp. MAA4]MDH6134420.1 D-alanyl-D-alanine carboxypeptidase [Kitasatospora sp. MAA4]
MTTVTRSAARFVTTLLAAAALLPLAGPASAAPTTANAPADRAALQQALGQLVADGIPGVTAEVRDGAGTWRGTSGVADLADGQPAAAQDRFRVGSVTKSFVATVVLQLVTEGRIGLDDPIDRDLPGVVANGQHITVRQLLNHTSGLYDYLNVVMSQPDPIRTARTAGYTPQDLIALSAAHSPQFAPGTSWAYSNTNYVVLGLLVEHLTGRPLGEEITRRIVRPLHLRDTSFPTTAQLSGPHLDGYEWLDGPAAAPTDLTEFSPSAIWGAGTMISTADDLSRFYRALFAGALLPQDLLNQMRTPHPIDDSGRAYGLGLESRTYCSGTPAWGHSGSVAGYETFSFTTADGARQITLALNRNLTASPKADDDINRVLTLGLCNS